MFCCACLWSLVSRGTAKAADRAHCKYFSIQIIYDFTCSLFDIHQIIVIKNICQVVLKNFSVDLFGKYVFVSIIDVIYIFKSGQNLIFKYKLLHLYLCLIIISVFSYTNIYIFKLVFQSNTSVYFSQFLAFPPSPYYHISTPRAGLSLNRCHNHSIPTPFYHN